MRPLKQEVDKIYCEEVQKNLKVYKTNKLWGRLQSIQAASLEAATRKHSLQD